jgi:hypothetical protein
MLQNMSYVINALLCKWYISSDISPSSINKYKSKSEVPGRMEINDEASITQPLYLLKRGILNALTVNIAPLSRLAFGPPENLLPERPSVPTSVLIYFLEVVLEMMMFSWEEFSNSPDGSKTSIMNMLTIKSGECSTENITKSSGTRLNNDQANSVQSSRRGSWTSNVRSPTRVNDRGADIYILAHIPLSNLNYWFMYSLQHNSLYSNKMYSLVCFCILKRRRYWNYGLDLLIYGDASAGVNGLVDELCKAYPFVGLECAVYCRLLCNVLRYPPPC